MQRDWPPDCQLGSMVGKNLGFTHNANQWKLHGQLPLWRVNGQRQLRRLEHAVHIFCPFFKK